MKPFSISILFLAAAVLPLSAAAQSGGAASEFNPVLFMLTTLVLVLAAAAALLAVVLKNLVAAYVDKKEQERRPDVSGKILPLLLAALLAGIPAIAQEAAPEAVAYVSPYISGIPRAEFYLLSGLLLFELLVMLVLVYQIRSFARLLRGIPAKAHVPARIFRRNFLDIFNKSVAVEKEAAIVLDHEYDGIRELDNDLPPWWKWGFVLTVIVSFVYMGYYHAAGGPSQAEEYNMAVAQAEEEKAAFLAKSGDKIDESNVTMVLDAAELANAQTLFKNTCASCHREDGGGNVGPNLTDDYWLHGGSLQDVFKSVKYGWRDKGMPPWGANFSGKQLAAITSYVKSLKGTNPAGAKPAQGDLFVEGGDGAIDSVSNATDPSLEPSGKKENKDNPLLPLQEPLKK